MTITQSQPVEFLNQPDASVRLQRLEELIASQTAENDGGPGSMWKVNNHIHTTYSFSPFTPTSAVWKAREAGLRVAGIMDHDTMAGAKEFKTAGRIAGIETTIGFECRVHFADTPFAGRSINNPDQASIAYVAVHGVPEAALERVEDFLSPLRAKRNERNRRMVDELSKETRCLGFELSFDKDVLPLSLYSKGGVITERHMLMALGKKLVGRFGRGEELMNRLSTIMKVSIPEKAELLLMDDENPHYEFDLLMALKNDFIRRFYLDATDECPPVSEIVGFAKDIGAIMAYAYLGDVSQSVTGDKRPMKFEDDYLDELVAELRRMGFQAITYMPSRNRKEQLDRIHDLCTQHSLLPISGEDINSPRQRFVCPMLEEERFSHLVTSSWALVGHEREANIDPDRGMFAPKAAKRHRRMTERMRAFAKIGKG